MPEWIWILLAIPTVVSLSVAALGFLLAGIRHLRWRRRREDPPAVIYLRPKRNGGAKR